MCHSATVCAAAFKLLATYSSSSRVVLVANTSTKCTKPASLMPFLASLQRDRSGHSRCDRLPVCDDRARGGPYPSTFTDALVRSAGANISTPGSPMALPLRLLAEARMVSVSATLEAVTFAAGKIHARLGCRPRTRCSTAACVP